MRISLPSFIIIGAVLTCSPLFGQGSGGQPPRNPPTGKEPQKSPINKTGDVTYEMGGVLFN
ncbi:MAG: hypothetical protein WCN98_11375, partial [Verrucomicrobiaceae bacterium]